MEEIMELCRSSDMVVLIELKIYCLRKIANLQVHLAYADEGLDQLYSGKIEAYQEIVQHIVKEMKLRKEG